MLSHSTSQKFFPLGQSLNEAVVHAIFGGSTLLTWNGTKIESHHRGDSKLHWMCTPKLKICAGQGPASPLHSGLRIFPNCSCASRNVSSHPGTETHNSSKISTQNKKDIWALKKHDCHFPRWRSAWQRRIQEHGSKGSDPVLGDNLGWILGYCAVANHSICHRIGAQTWKRGCHRIPARKVARGYRRCLVVNILIFAMVVCRKTFMAKHPCSYLHPTLVFGPLSTSSIWNHTSNNDPKDSKNIHATANHLETL